MCEGIKSSVDPDLNRVFIDAWNEFPENSLIEPTIEFGYDYIDVVRDVFCEEPTGGWPPNLYPTNDGIKEYTG